MFSPAILLVNQNAFIQEQVKAPGFNESTSARLEMRAIDPAMISGRIADIVINPEDPGTCYVRVCSGGI